MSRSLALAILGVLSLGFGGPAKADDIRYWEQSPRVFMPGSVELGPMTVSRGDVIFEHSLRWLHSARLPKDVTIRFEEHAITLSNGLQLPAAAFFTKSDEATQRFAYCTRMGAAHTKNAFITDKWLFQEPFNAKRKQLCFEDTNSDGMLDNSFVKTDQHLSGRPDIIYTGPVEPFSVQHERLAEIDGETDKIKLGVGKITNKKTRLYWSITRYPDGGRMNFSSLQSGGYQSSSIVDLKLGKGAFDMLCFRFELQSSDKASDLAEFTASRSGNPEFLVIPDYVQGW